MQGREDFLKVRQKNLLKELTFLSGIILKDHLE